MSFNFNQVLSNAYVQTGLGVLVFVFLLSLTGVCSGSDDTVVADTTTSEVAKDFHTVSSSETLDDNDNLEVIVEPEPDNSN